MTIETVIPLYGGYSLAKDDGVVFVRGAVPGETVEADIVEKKRDYRVAVVRSVITPSPDRIEPLCPVFDICGGCHYQFISYERQLRIKEEITLDCLRRIAKMDARLDATVAGEPWHYRRRAQLKVSRDGRIGFFRPLSHDVVEFEDCLILDPLLNQAIKRIKECRVLKRVREIHLQRGDTTTAKIIGASSEHDLLIEELRNSGVSGGTINSEISFGEPSICLPMEIKLSDGSRLSYFYRVSVDTFFQSNWALNQKLIGLILEYVRNIRPARVIDIYAGAGNISLALSAFAGEVVAVEENPKACSDGQENLELNRIGNVRFLNQRAERLKSGIEAEMVVLDPPRTGLTKEVRRKLAEISPEWIIYLSCNPATFSRDMGALGERYHIESIRVIDMFPQTYHIELLGILKMKNR